jgi:2-phospho-L-lactate/phosphoenolpyruvate guanylyltransferase
VTAAVLIPVKDFRRAKLRLGQVLNPSERATLARHLATRVVAAARGLPVSVVCDDDDVARWAEARGTDVIWAPGLGLNGAVAYGVDMLSGKGARRVVVCHADLPFARDLAAVAQYPGVTLVPDRHHDGTNVICIPGGCGFRFAYGPGSFARHRREATRVGLPWRVIDDDVRLSWDIDRADDLAFPRELAAEAAGLVPARCA